MIDEVGRTGLPRGVLHCGVERRVFRFPFPRDPIGTGSGNGSSGALGYKAAG